MYIIVIIGLVVLALGVKPINDSAKDSIPQLEDVDTNTLLIAGIVILVFGALMLRRSKGGVSKGSSEVPIYEGKNVVGYRRG